MVFLLFLSCFESTRNMHRCISLAFQIVVCAPALLLAAQAHAQLVPPDAGAVRQQIEQAREFPQAPAVQAPPSAAVPPSPTLGSVAVNVRLFRFQGNRLLSNEQLAEAVKGFVNRRLDWNGLQRAADAVASAYRESGWLAQVALPEQDISDSVVTLQVVEAHFAGLRIEGTMPRRVAPAEIEAYITARQSPGQPLQFDTLERALLLADDLPGVGVAGTLAPGSREGETELVLQMLDEPLLYGDAGIDNSGARTTGSVRQTLNLNVNSPGARGELLNLSLLHSQGSDYVRVGLTVPDGYNGLRLGINGSGMQYRVITAAGASAQLRGRSGSLGIDWSYPLLRSRQHNLNFVGGLENKSFINRDITQVRSDYETNSLRMGLSDSWFDTWGAGGMGSASLQMVQGWLTHLKEHPLKDRIERAYRKLSYSVSRQQTVNAQHSLLLSVTGQYTNQMLDSSEKFYIGGMNSVRAYPASELGGERGQVLSAEWRWRLHPAWTAAAFVDSGRITQLATNPSETTSTLRLRGSGLSLAWTGPRGLNARLSWSRRIGVNPKPTSTGTDSDGTLVLNRLWLNLGLNF